VAEVKIAIRLESLPLGLKRSRDLERAFALAQSLGASAVEIDARETIRPSELSDTGLRQLRKMLDDSNLRVAALRFQTRHGYGHADGLDRRVEATKSAMEFAYRLGSPVVVNQIGRVPDSKDDSSWQELRAVLEDLGSYGARVGAFLAAETGTESGDKLAEILEAGDDGFVGVVLNPGALIVNRHSVSEAIAALTHRIQLVRAVDGVVDLAAGRGISVPLGRGTADFPDILGRLEDAQYRGCFVVGREGVEEDDALNEIESSIEYLTNM
jgi:sugar phosphate isomerase/epimerase